MAGCGFPGISPSFSSCNTTHHLLGQSLPQAFPQTHHFQDEIPSGLLGLRHSTEAGGDSLSLPSKGLECHLSPTARGWHSGVLRFAKGQCGDCIEPPPANSARWGPPAQALLCALDLGQSSHKALEVRCVQCGDDMVLTEVRAGTRLCDSHSLGVETSGGPLPLPPVAPLHAPCCPWGSPTMSPRGSPMGGPVLLSPLSALSPEVPSESLPALPAPASC